MFKNGVGVIPSKRIKSSFETNSHINTKKSAINPTDPNLFRQQHVQASSLRTPFRIIETNNVEGDKNIKGKLANTDAIYVTDENVF